MFNKYMKETYTPLQKRQLKKMLADLPVNYEVENAERDFSVWFFVSHVGSDDPTKVTLNRGNSFDITPVVIQRGNQEISRYYIEDIAEISAAESFSGGEFQIEYKKNLYTLVHQLPLKK